MSVFCKYIKNKIKNKNEQINKKTNKQIVLTSSKPTDDCFSRPINKWHVCMYVCMYVGR